MAKCDQLTLLRFKGLSLGQSLLLRHILRIWWKKVSDSSYLAAKPIEIVGVLIGEAAWNPA